MHRSAFVPFALAAALLGVVAFVGFASTHASSTHVKSSAIAASFDVDAESATPSVYYRTVEIDGLDIAYREAGPRNAPTILLLHGFPTSSHMYRNLIPRLADRYHVIAPDYPGFGNSSMPDRDDFDYTFDNFAGIVDTLADRLELSSYSLYLMDYGAPVGFRLATAHPERVQSIIIQNGNAYEEGLKEFWDPIKAYWNEPTAEHRDALRGLLTIDATQWQYTHGVRNEQAISPDNWNVDQRLLDRPGNQEIQLDLFYDYRTNVPLYPVWQQYLRDHQPPVLITWGANDHIFPADGAHPYQRDVKNLDFHLLDTGHFALEEDGGRIADLMLRFLDKQTPAMHKMMHTSAPISVKAAGRTTPARAAQRRQICND